MMNRQARQSGLVMGLDTHMIAGSRACSTSTRPTNPTITNKTSPHYDEALNTAVAVFETQGPVVTEALRRLDRADTVAWKAVNLVEVTDEECSWSSARSASNVAGIRPIGWSPPSTCLGKTTRHRNG
jgi:hypothetical protein